jgi:hypothetical protein
MGGEVALGERNAEPLEESAGFVGGVEGHGVTVFASRKAPKQPRRPSEGWGLRE